MDALYLLAPRGMGMPDRAEEKRGAPPPDEAADGPMRVVVGAETPIGLGMLNPPVAGMVEILGELTTGVTGFGMPVPPGAGMVEMSGLPVPGAMGRGAAVPPGAGIVEVTG